MPHKSSYCLLAVPSGMLMLWERFRTPSQEELRVKSFRVKNMDFGAKLPGYQSCLCSYYLGDLEPVTLPSNLREEARFVLFTDVYHALKLCECLCVCMCMCAGAYPVPSSWGSEH